MAPAFLVSTPVFARGAAPRAACAARRGAIVSCAAAGDAAVRVTGIADVASPLDVPALPDSEAIKSLADVQDIVRLAKEFELADLRLQDGNVTVEVSLPGGRGFKEGKLLDLPQPQVVAAPQGQLVGAPGVAEVAYEDESEMGVEEEMEMEPEYVEDKAEEEADEDGVFKTDFTVTSNRVGFFFSGAKGKPPLVNVDDHVAFNQPVCIIEQLGQQYVYLSEVSGTVVKIFVEDGDAIQYGSQVMVIRPD